MRPYRMPHITANIDSYITITRMANGWQVTFPRFYAEPNTEREIADGMSEGIKEMMPVFKELMKIKDQDPLLAKLQGENPDEQHQEDPDPEPETLIGQEKYSYVFGTFREVLTFLDDKFTGEDGY